MWYVKPNDEHTAPRITLAYQTQPDCFIVLQFHIILPSVIHIEATDKNKMFDVSTDAPITKSRIMRGDPHEHGFLAIQYGRRYGNYTVVGEALTYVHDFWKIPSIQLTDSQRPIMILVRPRDVVKYTLGVAPPNDAL